MMQSVPPTEPLETVAEPLETVVIFRSPRSLMGSFFLLIVLFFLSIYLTANFDWSVQTLSLGTWNGRNIAFSVSLFALPALALVAYIVHALWNCRYILCEEYVLEVRGLLDLRRESIRLNYTHIRGVEISASIWQQLWRVSDIDILSDVSAISAGRPSEASIQLRGVSNAHEIKNLIQERIKHHTAALISHRGA